MMFAPEPMMGMPSEYDTMSSEYGAVPSASEGYFLLPSDSGSPPLKLSRTDAQRIQEHTGYPPEEIEDYDLQNAMQELNIHPAPLTPDDYRAVGMEPPQGGSTTVVVQRSHPGAPQKSLEEQLKSLHDLQQNGLISEEDYNAKKKQLLGI
jgi:Short C-terminal domain